MSKAIKHAIKTSLWQVVSKHWLIHTSIHGDPSVTAMFRNLPLGLLLQLR